ncbi:pilus assembly protein TadG-related protein [Candidatus Chlorohelix sp.]|uniref:pilus assembly protein TadG-related protein n=1 Tax=Candidatus Chlorohelix sp. TaxID=3139201 RepID=UPI00306C2299
MNTIFITPLLWKRLNRAIRRREEGQAMVLIAAAAVAMVAIVGLSVDGGMSYWESQKLERAAESAALAGVVWVPSQPTVADARGRLTVESQGYNAFYESGNKQASYTKAQSQSGTPYQYVYYSGTMPTIYSYQVTLGIKVPHYFMSVIGFGDYYIEKTATAQYATPARLGGSFNYFGSSSLKYDWIIRDQATYGGGDLQGIDYKEYYRTLWNRYVKNRCDQTNLPNPCIGGFWLNTQGPETNHSSGDAYSAVSDGATAVTNSGNNPYTNSVTVNAGTGYSAGASCLRQNDYSSWALTQSWWFTLSSGCNLTSVPNVANQDLHPDGNGARGFGYSVAVQLNTQALKTYTGDPYDSNGYTSFRVSIYDAAEADVGGQEVFGSGDNYWSQTSGAPNSYGVRPYSGISGTGTTATRQSNASSRTDDASLNCVTTNLPAVGSQSRYENGKLVEGGTVNTANRYCQNGMRTRFSLYYPPLSDGTPTTWQTKGSMVAAFDVTELTAQNEHWGSTGADNSTRCYFADVNYPNNATPQSPDSTFVFACPAGQGSGTVDDMYWNAYPNSSFPISYTKRITPLNASAVNGVNNANQNLNIDPSQNCRSVGDSQLYNNSTDYANAVALNGWIDPPYIGDRIPYNMRGYDPTWTTRGTYVPVYTTRNVTYNGGYQSYHGWRCSWDFDTNNTLNPGPSGDYTQPGKKDVLRQLAEGVNNNPYMYISDYGYLPGSGQLQRIKYVDGQRLAAATSDTPNVRNGVYLLQAQVFGGGGTNRYAIKAEYDNPQTIQGVFTDVSGNSVTKQIPPVPQVYGISSMNIYVNAINTQAGALNVIFDLAYIPVENADSLATLELFDAGDVGIENLNVQILTPSGYGQNLKADGTVPIGTALAARAVACPMEYIGVPSIGCAYGSLSVTSTAIKTGGSFFNDQWLFLIFRVPSSTQYDAWGTTCNLQFVPDFLCNYFQVNYLLNGSAGLSASDTTTWQLNIRNQPVRLIQ